jgi:hypothetical protein
MSRPNSQGVIFVRRRLLRSVVLSLMPLRVEFAVVGDSQRISGGGDWVPASDLPCLTAHDAERVVPPTLVVKAWYDLT